MHWVITSWVCERRNEIEKVTFKYSYPKLPEWAGV